MSDVNDVTTPIMPQHRQPVALLALCHAQVTTDLVATCRLLQLLAQDSTVTHALALARRHLRPRYCCFLPGRIRSQLIDEVSQRLAAPAPDGSAPGAASDVCRLRVELCCYYGCSHQTALLNLLVTEGAGLEELELARSALLRLDKTLLCSALIRATALRRLTLRNIAADAILQVVGQACPILEELDISHSRQVTDAGLRSLFLQVELRDKLMPMTPPEGSSHRHSGLREPGTTCRGWGRLKILLRLFPWLRRDNDTKTKDQSFLLEYCEENNPLCKTLKLLNVANTSVTSAGILLVLHHVSGLQSLGDYGHMGRTLEIMDRARVASRNTNDHPRFKLTSARSQHTTHHRLELLARDCPELEHLTVFEPHHSASSLLLFPASLSTLHLLHVPPDSTWVSDLYCYLATPQGGNICDLTIRFAPGETFVSLDLGQIVRSCPNLCILCEDGADIDWNEDGIPESFSLTKLWSVQLGRTVSAKALTELIRRSPHLRLAHFFSCPDLTDNHVIQLATNYGLKSQPCDEVDPCRQAKGAKKLLPSELECFYIYEAPRATSAAVISLLASCDSLVRTGNLTNWGLTCDGLRWIYTTVLANNLELEVNTGSHWFYSQCFPAFNTLLNCLLSNKLVHLNSTCLPHTIHSVTSLSLQLWVPMYVKQEEVIGANKVQTYTSSCQGQQHHLRLV
uniref:Uncharacterized protein n=1 Tax=Timema genevievae TaxID=629358 RepID=A0A7R9KAG0_TIMGE|nr:unnamed protein product [Timema genevievae]